jgi:PTH1 family peptidyl-tRNA hydrolase
VSDSDESLARKPRLIVGLGNPGRDYEDTRHNVGFMIVDALASQFNAPWINEKRWDCALAKFHGGWFLKPLTFMNASGSAVQAVCRFYKIAAQEVLAIYDDVDLPLGTLRLRAKGSAAGHNGVSSLIQHLGGENFSRLKVGIATATGRPAGERMVAHVLGKFNVEEKAALPEVITRAMQAVRTALTDGFENAMNQFNRKEKTPTNEKT